MIARIASVVVVVALGAGCKDRPEPSPRTSPAPAPPTKPAVVADAPVVDASVIDAPIDAGVALPDATKAERAMVAAGFAKLNGTEKLVIAGIDVEPFRRTHVGYAITDASSIKVAAVANKKRTFEVSKFVVAGEAARVTAGERVFMTFDGKNQLVGISY